jgi:cell division protein FtsB
MAQEIPPSNPQPRKRREQLTSVQVLFAAILAIGLALAISLSSRILAGQPLEEAYDRVLDEIDQLKREQAALIAERDYVRSDAYVEQWARDEGKMIREGEFLVIPVTSGITDETVPTPETAFNVETTLPEPEAWRLWWSLFFDSPPPDF